MSLITDSLKDVKSIFISKNGDEVSNLKVFCDLHDISLIATSFIDFQPVPFSNLKSFDVVFFASPRAAKFFLESQKLPDNCEIAVAGSNTKKFVEEFGYQVHYYPRESGNISLNKIEFKGWVGEREVLFPVSDRSNKSYASTLSDTQIQIIVVYKTQILDKIIDYCDLYAFTSPSNYDGFIQSNQIPAGSIIVVWGESTYERVEANHLDCTIFSLADSSVDAFIALLKK